MGKLFLKITTLTLALLTGLNVHAAQRKKTTPAIRPAIVTRALPKVPDPPPLAPGEPPLRARGAIVIDALSGKSIYEKNADEKQYPASTTKIMTALLVIEAGDLEKEVEITPEESKVGESSLNIMAGEHFKRRQMLYGLLLKSANDVAYALGRDNAGTMAAFAEKMTLRAQELGATSTHFMNPHGLHHIEHYTTPRDLALIARAAMQQPLFRQIVSTQKEPWVTEFTVRELHNHNRLLARYPGCTGVKTGYTIPAQQVLVSAALRQSREVIAVVMHTDKPGIWDDSMSLLTYGLEHPPGGEH
ncbi:MAG: Serine-type D-Ala-D-Ala carboxypeptidase [Chthoniobacteraceae bacterium]|nr:Serine-type D-Ala-D-Ala carboxypeptidase [Chthoniobacteraceae bacterium]